MAEGDTEKGRLQNKGGEKTLGERNEIGKIADWKGELLGLVEQGVEDIFGNVTLCEAGCRKEVFARRRAEERKKLLRVFGRDRSFGGRVSSHLRPFPRKTLLLFPTSGPQAWEALTRESDIRRIAV